MRSRGKRALHASRDLVDFEPPPHRRARLRAVLKDHDVVRQVLAGNGDHRVGIVCHLPRRMSARPRVTEVGEHNERGFPPCRQFERNRRATLARDCKVRPPGRAGAQIERDTPERMLPGWQSAHSPRGRLFPGPGFAHRRIPSIRQCQTVILAHIDLPLGPLEHAAR